MKFNKYFRLEEVSTINFTPLYHCSLQVVFYLLSLQLFVVTSLVFGRFNGVTWVTFVRMFFWLLLQSGKKKMCKMRRNQRL